MATGIFLEDLVQALQTSGRVALATVVRTRGSAPRGAGAQLFWDWKTGRSVGTVGGGAIEAAVLKQIQTGSQGGELPSQVLEYRLHPNEVADLGMICGGNADVLIQELTRESLPVLQRALERMQQQQGTILCLSPKTDGMAVWDAKGTALLVGSQEGWPHSVEPETARIQPVWAEGLFFYPVQLPYRTIVFGGGHVSQALIQAGQKLDMRFIVYEDREAFANPETFPAAEAVLLGSFEEIAKQLEIRETDQVCILTRGHLCDSVVLKQILRTPARYIGMMGSRRKVRCTFEELRQVGYSDSDLQRIHAPIGLDIGAETPDEIAISILAELIADRRRIHSERKDS